MESPLIQAVYFNRMPIARWFISDWGADPTRQNEDGETILSVAVFRSNFDAVEYILALPCASKLIENKNFLGEGPIHLAASEGDSRIIKILLKAGASPTARGFLDQNVFHLCASHVNKGAFCTFFDHIEQSSPNTMKAMLHQKNSNGGMKYSAPKNM
jgi:ankyrin repeat protein